MSLYYRLDGHDVVPVDEDDRVGLLAAFEVDRRVAWRRVGRYTVSTIFLIVDYHFGFGRPHVFETATFEDGELVDIVGRYATWEEAEAGHAQVVAELRGLGKDGWMDD